MAERLPFYLRFPTTTLPVRRSVNPFPYGVLIGAGSAWVSSTGWDSINDPGGTTGTAKVERYSLETGALQGSVSLGPYPAHGGGSLSAIHKIQCLDASSGAIIRTLSTARDPAFFDWDGAVVWMPCALDNLIELWPARETY